MSLIEILIPQTFEPLGVWIVFSAGVMWGGLGYLFSLVGSEGQEHLATELNGGLRQIE